MKITQDEVVDNQTTLHIELEDADLAPYLDRGYQRIADRVSIPGFRRGKAPRRVVEQVLGREQLLNEVLDAMAYETADKAVAQSELEAVAPPKIDELNMSEAIRVTATVPLRPEVRLGDYRATRIDFEAGEVAEEQVADQLDRIRQSLGTWEKEDRPARFGDLVTLDMRGFAEGDDMQIWGSGPQSFYLAEDGTSPLPGFAAEIVGTAAGGNLEFSLTVPEDFRIPEAAGKRASFNVDVLDVYERRLPELDDEFARGLPDGFESLEALRAEIRTALKRAADEQADSNYEELVIAALLEGAELTPPPVMIEREAERIVSQQFGFLENNNIRKEDYLASVGRTEDELREEAAGEARRRVSQSLALNHLAEAERFEAADSEITERFNQMYAGARMGRRDRRAARATVERMLRAEKAVQMLVSIAKGEAESEGGETAPDGIPNGAKRGEETIREEN